MKELNVPEKISDLWIIDNLIHNGKHVNGYKKYMDIPKIKLYLSERFDDIDNACESLYRIVHNIEIKPTCEYCGNPIQFNEKNGYKRFCSCSCANYGSKQIRIENSIKKWGTDSPNKALEVKNKAKQHFIDTYGVSNPSYVDEVKEKRKLTAAQNNSYKNAVNKRKITKFLKYGNSDFVNPEKFKHTSLLKYGVDNPAKSEKIKRKIEETVLKKYGVKCLLSSKEVHDLSFSNESLLKKYNTRKINGTFNSSKIEKLFGMYLDNNYPGDYVTLYKSDLYPFSCDFYIKSLDLYIEIQGSWTHGGHQFDNTNKDDIQKLEEWKNKKSKYYDNAINTWIVRDVNKRMIANKNKLNYLEIFSCNIDECIHILNNHIQNKNTKI